VQLAAQLLDSNGLRGANIAAPSGGGSVTLPARGLELNGKGRGGDEGGSGESDGELRPQARGTRISDAQIIFATLQVNTHEKGNSATDLYALEMVDPESGKKLNVSDLASPVQLRMAPTSTAATGGGACEARFDSYNCSNRGTCVAGLCECDARFSGDDCATELRCKFWSDAAWRDDGLSTSFDQTTGQLVCSTTHFTDFMGLHLPTTQDQFEDEVKNLIITLPCADGWFAAFDYSENVFLYSVVFALALANMFSLPFFRYRYKVRRAWLHVKQQRKFYGQRLARSGWVARSKAKQANKQGTLQRVGTRFGLVGTSSARGLTRSPSSTELRASGRLNPTMVLVRNSLLGEEKDQRNEQDHTITRRRSSAKLQPSTLRRTSSNGSKRSLTCPKLAHFVVASPLCASRSPSGPMSRYKVGDSPTNLPSLDAPSTCAPAGEPSPTKRRISFKTSSRVAPDPAVAFDAGDAPSPPPSPPSNVNVDEAKKIARFSVSVDEEEIARFEMALAAARAARVLTSEDEADGALAKAKKAAEASRTACVRGDSVAGRKPLAKEKEEEEAGPQHPQHQNPKEAAARTASAAVGLFSPAGVVSGLAGPAWTRGEVEPPQGARRTVCYAAAVYTPAQQARLGLDTAPCKTVSAPPQPRRFWEAQVQLRTAHKDAEVAIQQAAAAAAIQKAERDKQIRVSETELRSEGKSLLQPALQFQMEVAQMRARIATHVAGKSHYLAEAAESAVAQKKFVKSQEDSRMTRMRQSIAASHTALLVREHNWSALAKHVRHESKQRIRVQVSEVVEHTRDRHTLISVALPLDLDELDPAHLRDEQAALIFWNVVVVELAVNAVWAGTSGVTSSCSVASNATDINATFNATFTGGMAESCTGGGNFRILTAIVTGMFGAAMLIITALTCRVVFRIGNKPSRRKWLWRSRSALAWGLNSGFFVFVSWTIVAYGRCYTRPETNSMLLSFLVGCGVSWGLMEPLFIALVTLLPCFRSNKFFNWVNERANDIGLDLSLIIG